MPIQVRKIVSAAAQLIGRDDLYKKLQGAEEDDEVNLLLGCFHLVESEAALGDFPLKTRESFSPAEGRIAFSSFRKYPVNVLSVTSPSGMGIPFELLKEEIAVEKDAGEVEVLYTYAPTEKGREETAEISERIPIGTLSHGVAAKYMCAHGLYAEAEHFESIYREGLLSARSSFGKRLRLGTRRWV